MKKLLVLIFFCPLVILGQVESEPSKKEPYEVAFANFLAPISVLSENQTPNILYHMSLHTEKQTPAYYFPGFLY